MTQDELDALLNEDAPNQELELESELQAPSQELEFQTKSSKIDQESVWPPPPPTPDHKVVHQLDDVTRDSEVKASETFDKLEAINNAGMDIEDSLKKIETFLHNQSDLLQKLSAKFPDFHIFQERINELQEARLLLETISSSTQTISDASLEAMDIMQYQDIHRQKIERVINVMRALSRYMSLLFEGKIDDAKRTSSAAYIKGDTNTEDVVSEDDIEALIANFGK